MKIEIAKPNDLAWLIAQVEPAMSRDATRPNLNCIHMVMHEKGALYAVATDGHRIHVVTSGNVDEIKADHPLRRASWLEWASWGDETRAGAPALPPGWVHIQLHDPSRFRSLCRNYSGQTIVLYPGTFRRTAGEPGPSESEVISVLDVGVPGPYGRELRHRFAAPESCDMISHLRIIPSDFGCWKSSIDVGLLKAFRSPSIAFLGTFVDGYLTKPFDWAPIELQGIPSDAKLDGRTLVRVNRKYATEAAASAAAIGDGERARMYGCGSLDPVVFLGGDHHSTEATFVGVVMPESV